MYVYIYIYVHIYIYTYIYIYIYMYMHYNNAIESLRWRRCESFRNYRGYFLKDPTQIGLFFKRNMITQLQKKL